MDLGKPGHLGQFAPAALGTTPRNGPKQFNPLHGVITQYRIDCGTANAVRSTVSRPLAIFGKDFTPTRVPLFERLGRTQANWVIRNRSYRQTSWIEKDFSSSQDLGQTRQGSHDPPLEFESAAQERDAERAGHLGSGSISVRFTNCSTTTARRSTPVVSNNSSVSVCSSEDRNCSTPCSSTSASQDEPTRPNSSSTGCKASYTLASCQA